jgi:hypothetical protein
MEWITQEEAYNMGRKAYSKGLPSSPLMNHEFWEMANKIDGHQLWKSVIRAYSEGWHEEVKVPK